MACGFFANCIRGGLSIGHHHDDLAAAPWRLQGRVYNANHLHCISTLAFAFTVFWAYVTSPNTSSSGMPTSRGNLLV